MSTWYETTNTTVDGSSEQGAGSPAQGPAAATRVPLMENADLRPQRRLLYRHPSDKVIAGVCGGLGEYLGWDPIFVRALWVVATLITWGGGFLAYLLLALFLPIGTNSVGQVRQPAIALDKKSMNYAAGALIVLGAVWLLANVGILPGLWRVFAMVVQLLFWPAVLVTAGYLLLRANSQRDLSKEVREAATRVRDTVEEKLPTGGQVKSSFASFRSSMPLRRSRTDRMVLGVAGGLAQKTGIDAALLRLLWVAFSIGSMGTGVLIYAVLALLMPEEELTVPMARGNGSAENVQDIKIVDSSARSG